MTNIWTYNNIYKMFNFFETTNNKDHTSNIGGCYEGTFEIINKIFQLNQFINLNVINRNKSNN